MCGISGIVGQGWNKSQLSSMVNSLSHRGPDDSGLYISDNKKAGFGHNRLSIIDLSENGHQPMSNYDGTCWITFNGEIYNYLELKNKLSDYPFRSDADTEIILAAYEIWGEKCVRHFNGMFAFAIWDDKKQKLFCARDRVGIKPFYYVENNSFFMFASEIKALLAAGWKAEPNWSTWAAYLMHGLYDHTDHTFFNGVLSLNPGYIMTWQQGDGLRIKKYWDIDGHVEEEFSADKSYYCRKLIDLFEDSIRLRLQSDVPVGVNLSGGLDSGSLMVTLENVWKEKTKIEAFTAIYNDPTYDEDIFSEVVNTNADWALHTSVLDVSKVWDNLKDVMWHQEAPFGGISTVAYHNLHKTARDMGITVLLEGQGVDEMLAGYRYFHYEHSLDLEKNETTENSISSLEEEASVPQTLYQDGSTFLSPNCLSEEIRESLEESVAFRRPFKSHLANALYRDFKFTKLPRVLRMNDHLSMAFGRELREPYLDHRIVEFLFSLPSSMKIKNGQTKYLLREAIAGRLHDNIRCAEKRGVVSPQREWLRKELRTNIQDLITSKSFVERGIFKADEVKKQYNNYCSNPSENSFFIWQWINTELWFKTFEGQIEPTHHFLD